MTFTFKFTPASKPSRLKTFKSSVALKVEIILYKLYPITRRFHINHRFELWYCEGFDTSKCCNGDCPYCEPYNDCAICVKPEYYIERNEANVEN